MNSKQKDYLANSVAQENNTLILASIVLVLLMVLMFFFGWLGGLRNLAEHPPTTDCRPPQTLSDKVVATLVPDTSGGLRISCHYETIQTYGGAK